MSAYFWCLWLGGFGLLGGGLLLQIRQRVFYSFGTLALLFWHTLFLVRVNEASETFGSAVLEEVAVLALLGALEWILLTALFARLLLRGAAREPERPNRLRISNAWIGVLSILLYWLSDPSLFLPDAVRARYIDLWFLQTIGLHLGFIFAAGFGATFRLRPSAAIPANFGLLAFIMYLAGGRAVAFAFVGGWLWRYFRSAKSRPSSLAAKFFVLAAFGYLLGVVLRDLRGLLPTQWGAYVSAGDWGQNLRWESSESDIYLYFCYVVYRGWSEIVVLPAQSLAKAATAVISVTVGGVPRIPDTTQSLWLDLYSARMLEFADTRFSPEFLDYPGSIPPTLYGEGLLNGGYLGLAIFVALISLAAVLLERYLRTSPDPARLSGIYFVSMVYVLRGSFYWGLVTLGFCVLLLVFGRMVGRLVAAPFGRMRLRT